MALQAVSRPALRAHSRTTAATAVTAVLLALVALAGPAHADAGDIVLRARALYLDPANEGTDTAAAISLSSKYIWELDASYFVTPNVALELIATNPQRHTVYLSGTRVGTLRHLPPTLTAQYHFAPSHPTVRPYLGLGLNHTHLSAVNVSVASSHDVTLDKHSWGLAYNVGANFPLGPQLSLNVDFKKIDIQTEAKLNGAKIGTVKVDPVLFGIGIGYTF